MGSWVYVEDQAPVPGADLPEAAAGELAASWALIVDGRLGEAELHLAPLRSSASNDPGVLSADGFLALRSGRIFEGGALFQRALKTEPRDILATLGTVLIVLDGQDPEVLFQRLQRLSELEPDAAVVTEKLPGLTLDVAESRILRARDLTRSDAGGPDVANAYRGALEAMPNSADLFLEAAEAAAAAGAGQNAREWFDTVASSPSASKRQALVAALAAAELLANERRLAESLTRLDRILRATELRGFSDLRTRASDLERRLEVARLSELYSRIREAERITREQLAALLAGEIGGPPGGESGSQEPVIAIDLERSWAANLIQTAVEAGYLRLYPDHTFKPRGLVTRAELAEALAATIARFDPEVRRSAAADSERLELGDVPAGHRHRIVAAIAVELDLLRTTANRMFRPRAFASGAEAVRAVHALRDLLGQSS